MNILAVNTAFEHLGVALSRNGELCGNYYSICQRRNDRLIFKVIEDLLTNVQLQLQDIDLFVVVHGPGNYTGLRIGIGVVKTFAQVNQKPLVGVDSLQLLAALSPKREEPFHVLLNCTKTEVFHARFLWQEQEPVRQNEIRLTTLEECLPQLQGKPVILQRYSTTHKHTDPLLEQLNLIPLRRPEPDASLLIPIGLKLFQNQNGGLPPVQPLYIKKDA